MNLESILPPLPGANYGHVSGPGIADGDPMGLDLFSADQMHAHALAAARAGAVAALDKAMKQVADAWNDRDSTTNQYEQALRSASLIRRLRDTIMEGK